MHYPFETQITPLCNVRRERLLESPGQVVVSEGERVEPFQVVARMQVPGDFVLINVAQALNVPAKQAAKHYKFKSGAAVRKGDVLAKKGATCQAPIEGVVRDLGLGRILVEGTPRVQEIRAYLYGTVTNVMREFGVVIETSAAVVQGAWGAGGESSGVLKLMVKGPSQPIKAKGIDSSCHGLILVGGTSLDEAVLERAQEIQVRGIVVGGIPASLLPKLASIPFPVVATEGVGKIPMSQAAFQLLRSHNGREACISGLTCSRWRVRRPEVVIPLPASGSARPTADPGSALRVGDRVHIVRGPQMGTVGAVTALPKRPLRVNTGARLACAEVDLGNGETVTVPLLNLEVIR